MEKILKKFRFSTNISSREVENLFDSKNNSSENMKEGYTTINSIPVFSKYSSLVSYMNEYKTNSIEKEIKEDFLNITKRIINIGLPTTFFFLTLFFQQTICLSYIGKKYNNQDFINCMGIVNLYINCALYSFAVGLISGLDILLSNALAMNNFYLFGVYIKRARLITYATCLILSIFHFLFGIKILSFFLEMNPEISNACLDYIYTSILYVMLHIQFMINFRVLSIIDKWKICFLILIVSITLHPVWCNIFIDKLDYKLLGAGLTLVIAQLINMVTSTFYVEFCRPLPKESYFRINKDCFKGWGEYFKLTLPSTFMLVAEWLAFEVQAIFAIYLSKSEYSTHIFISSIATLIYTLCNGFGVAATVLVGEQIAKGDVKNSKKIAVYCFVFAEMTMSILIIIVILMRNSILKIFIDDEDIIEMGKPLIVVLAVGEIFDITQNVMSSIYRGIGKQVEASLIGFVQYYFIQTFLSWLLAFYFKLGVTGLWYSICLGNFITTVIFIFFFTRFDFDKINRDVKERFEKDQELINKKNIVPDF